MSIFQIAIFGISAAVLSLVLKKDNAAFAIVISVVASVIIFLAVVPQLSGIMDLLNNITAAINTDIPFVPIVVKILGIAYISEFSAQLINDAGETAIASKIELAGKILIMTVSAPIIFALVNQVIIMLP